jgi:DNA-binding MarR family transcriptional regulator
MDDTHLSVPVGVQHVKYRHRERFTVVGNHLAQNRRLSLTAIGLGVHIQSLPDGSRIGIKDLVEAFSEGELRIAGALRELEAEGYLERKKVRVARGRFATLTTFFEHPAARVRAVVDVDAQSEPPSAEEREGAVAEEGFRLPADFRTALPRPRSEVSETRRRMAHELLAGLRVQDRRLMLSRADVERLAPAVCAWMERGIGYDEVRSVLLRGMPEGDIGNPAGIVRWRLAELLPYETPERPAYLCRARPAVEPRLPLQTCEGCERAYRAAKPGGHCRECLAQSDAAAVAGTAVAS